jgi:carbon starvation protein
MVFMLIMTGWAMLINLNEFYTGANWLLFFIGLVVFVLEIWMIIESVLVIMKLNSKAAAPPMAG